MSRRTLVLLILTLSTLWTTGSAAAHTEVQRATPGPGDVVEGEVDEIVLVFLDEIQPGATVEVSGPGGAVAASAPDQGAKTVRVATESMKETGDYVVRYSFTAMDGDHQSEAYRFRIDTADSDPLPVGAVIAGAGVAVAVVAAVLRRRRGRRTNAA